MKDKSKKVTAIDYIVAFAMKQDLSKIHTVSEKHKVKRADFSGIGRVWNDGHGFLKLADLITLR